MVFHKARVRVKELAETLGVETDEIIATCILLKIPASSPLTSLSVVECKKIIDYLKKE
tara:strand:+ start:1257 stop:1430 length:174 start_codon:yes stop_codon:yes gene_type:complete